METVPPPPPPTPQPEANWAWECVGNYCRYAQQNIPVMIGAASHAAVQLGKQNYGEAFAALSRIGPYMQKQVQAFKDDLSIVHSLVARVEQTIKTMEQMPFALCSLLDLKRALEVVKKRLTSYSSQLSDETTFFNSVKEGFYMGRNVEQYRSNLSLDINLLMFSLVNINQEVLLRQAQLLSIENRAYATPDSKRKAIYQFLSDVAQLCHSQKLL